jgi:hypothetical protein
MIPEWEMKWEGSLEEMGMQVKHLMGMSVVVAALLVGGCGQRTLPTNPTYPVRARILLNGEPASYVLVRFTPTGDAGAEAVGWTDRDGYFELRTYSNEGNDGAVPGEYKVVIEDYDPVRSGPLPAGATAAKVPGGSQEAKQTYTIASADNDFTVEVP